MVNIDLSLEYIDISEKLKLKNLLWKDVRAFKQDYYKSIDLFCSVVYDYLVELYDSGVRNFREFDNYNMFFAIYNKEQHDGVIKLLFGENVSLEKYVDENTLETFLYDSINDILFDRYCYEMVSRTLKKINLLSDKRELNPQKMAKNLLAVVIEDKRLEREIKLKKLEKNLLQDKQDLFDIIESCVCWIGNKSKQEISNMYLWEVREGFNRIQVFEYYKLIMSGYYAGTVTLQQNEKDKLEWTKSLTD